MSEPVFAQYQYLIDFDGDGTLDHAYADISAYVITASFVRGAIEGSPHHSAAGQLTLSLQNISGFFSADNVSSPIYGLIIPNLLVRMIMISGGSANLFTGYLEDISPDPSSHVNAATATLRAYGIITRIQNEEADLALKTNATTGSIIEDILDAASISEYTCDTGDSTISKWWMKPGSKVLAAIRELEDHELGHIAEHPDGELLFFDRSHYNDDSRSNAVQSTYGTGTLNIWNIRQINSLKSIVNYIEAPLRTFNQTEDEVLLSVLSDVYNDSGGTPLVVPGSGSLTMFIDCPKEYLGVTSWGTTDYEANTAADASGSDITADISPAKTSLGNRLQIIFTNANASDANLVVLRQWGVGTVEGDSVPLKSSNATSIGKYGRQTYPYSINWITNQDDGQAKLDYIVSERKDPKKRIVFDVMANYDAAHLTEAKTRREGDRIRVVASLAEFNLGIDDEFIVDAVQHRVSETNLHIMTLYCSEAPSSYLAADATARTALTQYEAPSFVVWGPFTNNDPSAGYVSWANIVIVYYKQQFIIEDDNTNDEWVYWNAASPNVLSHASSFPTLSDTVLLVGRNKSGTFYKDTDQAWSDADQAQSDADAAQATADSKPDLIDTRYYSFGAVDIFEEAWEEGTDALGFWAQSGGSRQVITGGVKGGNVIEGTAKVFNYSQVVMPFDPSLLYRIFFRARRTYTETGEEAEQNFRIGAYLYDNEMGSLASPSFVTVNLYTYTLDEWVEGEVWIKGADGWSGSGTAIDPFVMYSGTAYWRLFFYLNLDNTGGSNISENDVIRVVSFDPEAQNRVYNNINSDGTTADDMAPSDAIPVEDIFEYHFGTDALGTTTGDMDTPDWHYDHEAPVTEDADYKGEFNPATSYSVNDAVITGSYWDAEWSSSRNLYTISPWGWPWYSPGWGWFSVVVTVNTSDTLTYSTSIEGSGVPYVCTLTIKLANSTASKNTAALIEAMIRAIGVINFPPIMNADVSDFRVCENAAYAASRPTSAPSTNTDQTGTDDVWTCIQACQYNYFPPEEASYWNQGFEASQTWPGDYDWETHDLSDFSTGDNPIYSGDGGVPAGTGALRLAVRIVPGDYDGEFYIVKPGWSGSYKTLVLPFSANTPITYRDLFLEIDGDRDMDTVFSYEAWDAHAYIAICFNYPRP